MKSLPSDTLAGLRAVVGHGAHADGEHNLVQGGGGLHRDYHSVFSLKTELKDGREKSGGLQQSELQTSGKYGSEYFHDALDAITILDRIDAGFSLLIRINGNLPDKEKYGIGDLVIDTYIPPREIKEHGVDIERGIAKVIGVFAKDIAIQHLEHLKDRLGRTEDIGPRTVLELNKNSLACPSLIPAPEKEGSSWFQITGPVLQKFSELTLVDEYGDFAFMGTKEVCDAVDEATSIEGLGGANRQKDVMKGDGAETPGRVHSKSVRFGELGTGTHNTKLTKLTRTAQRGSLYPCIPSDLSPAAVATISDSMLQSSDLLAPPSTASELSNELPDPDIFFPELTASLGAQTQTPTPEVSFSLSPTNASPIISIGPITDSVIDRFSLGDSVILYLRHLSTTVRSSRWIHVLKSQGFDSHIANAISDALLADLAAIPGKETKVMF